MLLRNVSLGDEPSWWGAGEFWGETSAPGLSPALIWLAV